MKGEIITKKNYPEIYKWLSENIQFYKNDKYNQQFFTLTKEDKINVYRDTAVRASIKEFKYPFGYVNSYFDMANSHTITSLIGTPEIINGAFEFSSCYGLTSLIGFPKYIGGDIYLTGNKFSNNPDYEERYNLYIDMWFELLDSVSGNERVNYINNYKNRVDSTYCNPILPKNVINKYKIDFLLNDK